MRVSVVLARPEGCESRSLEMDDGATVADAVEASGLALDGIAGYAVFGVRADAATRLREGDRVELLRPLRIDPKEARRRRAQGQAGKPR